MIILYFQTPFYNELYVHLSCSEMSWITPWYDEDSGSHGIKKETELTVF